jgi:hypothetical protein
MSKMARIALLLLVVLAAPARAAEPLTAEAAIDNYRKMFQPVALLDCPKAGGPDEIIVCGRPDGPDPNRLPLPSGMPGDRVRLLPGEPPSAVAALDAGGTGCSTVGPNQSCGGGMSVFQVVGVLAKAVKALTHGND